MEEQGYVASMPKGLLRVLFIVITILSIISCLGIYLAVEGIIYPENTPEKSVSADIILLCGMIGFIVVLYSLFLLCWFMQRRTKDIFYYNKLVRMKGKKKKFEIEYKDILRVQSASYETVLLYCKKPFNKGATTMIGHYNDNDLQNIKRIISNANFTVRFD